MGDLMRKHVLQMGVRWTDSSQGRATSPRRATMKEVEALRTAGAHLMGRVTYLERPHTGPRQAFIPLR
jgi:hypothetical protein